MTSRSRSFTASWLALVGALGPACGDDKQVVADLPAWERGLPPATVLGTHRGLVAARGIVHLHSPYSHDACDGQPRDASGAPNEPCLADLRAALCTNRIDYANLTDHDDSMADEEFGALFSMRGSDQTVLRDGAQIASRIQCASGHQVQVTVGSENELMPIMLDRHVTGSVEERHALYNGTDAAASASYRAAGGLTWIAHTESKSLELLREVAPSGVEVYNLHANIDPDIRRDYLGLPAAGGFTAALEYADTNPGHPEPDLAILAFLAPNPPSISKWETLLSEGRHVAVTAGTDAHQNALPLELADGERGDSYRRMTRWFSNMALVADPTDVDEIEAALATGRNFAVFEVLGTPEGLDIRATSPGGTVYELGATIPRAEGARLTIDIPRVRGLDPALPTPTIRARVYWIEPGGAAQLLVDGDGMTTGDGQVNVAMSAPGAYRIEITIVPAHLGPYLGDLGPAAAEVEQVWIYTSPFYVE